MEYQVVFICDSTTDGSSWRHIEPDAINSLLTDKMNDWAGQGWKVRHVTHVETGTYNRTGFYITFEK